MDGFSRRPGRFSYKGVALNSPEALTMTIDPIDYWNETAGPRWVTLQKPLDRLLHPLGARAMEWAQVSPGERVLDVGCGCGDTTLDLAEQVGPSGFTLGADVSVPMLERARRRAEALGSRARFRQADAQCERFSEGPFDLVFSRFGVMFFPDPVVAFANLKAALRPGGRLVFVCWQPMQINPLFQLALEAARPYLRVPPPSPPDVPGPFSLAPTGLAASLLEQAGFEEVCCQPFEEQIALGGLAETADFLLEMGPIVPVLAEVDMKTRQAVADRLCQLLSPLERDDLIFLGTCNWLVSAQALPG